MALPPHPLALNAASKQKLIAVGAVRERIRFESQEERDRRELAAREEYRSRPVVVAYNKLYSAFRRRQGRTPGPLEVKEIWVRAALANNSSRKT